jgi:hypothetical protein
MMSSIKNQSVAKVKILKIWKFIKIPDRTNKIWLGIIHKIQVNLRSMAKISIRKQITVDKLSTTNLNLKPQK